ncbi:hypothetical protein OUZ56_026724 [Daphnia magna]|uniref:Tfiih, polypeptide n=1 Tax=Daphnia magna TaxID=35525 RepID=A0ABQ9ZML3_9CRUS|nr:hypothetical protein OUZ56_026724 [Daphnia magna]
MTYFLIEQHPALRVFHKCENLICVQVGLLRLQLLMEKPSSSPPILSTLLGALTPFRKFPIGYGLDANSPHRNPETICSSGKTDD